jgi:hypothetical protein
MTARDTKSAPGKVGYGNPPRHTRFRKGQSGNPGGRPPRDPARRLKALTLQQAYRGVVIMENGRAEPVTAIEAVLRSQIELATKGNIQAQRAILAAVKKIEDDNQWEEDLAELRRGRSGRESGTEAREHKPEAAGETGDETNSTSQDL